MQFGTRIESLQLFASFKNCMNTNIKMSMSMQFVFILLCSSWLICMSECAWLMLVWVCMQFVTYTQSLELYTWVENCTNISHELATSGVIGILTRTQPPATMNSRRDNTYMSHELHTSGQACWTTLNYLRQWSLDVTILTYVRHKLYMWVTCTVTHHTVCSSWVIHKVHLYAVRDLYKKLRTHHVTREQA